MEYILLGSRACEMYIEWLSHDNSSIDNDIDVDGSLDSLLYNVHDVYMYRL